jgi:hypothetical protein
MKIFGKKGAELSFEMIVVIIILLVVLTFMLIFFLSQGESITNLFSSLVKQSINETEAIAGP